MKRLLCVLMVCFFCMPLLCGSSFSFADSGTPVKPNNVIYSDKDVQLNLSGMSGTVVYSMIYNIMSEPEKFLGKVIRLSGFYSAWKDPQHGTVYHSCVIPDATACCSQGMEFVWAGNHAYPKDYPEPGTDMIVTGRLESYMEGNYMYLHLVNAEVVWMKTEE